MDNTTTPRDNIKTALRIASSIPYIGQPANVILNIANDTGYFDKSVIDKLTHKELFYDNVFDAIPVHPELYKDLSCTCTPIGNDDLMCWKKGFIGALNKEQIKEYCPPEKRVIEHTVLTTRIKDFKAASDECEIGKTFDNTVIKDFPDRLKCMHDKLKEYDVSGVEV